MQVILPLSGRRYTWFCCAVVLTFVPTRLATAGIIAIDLTDPGGGGDSGWTAIYDSSLGPYVSIDVQGVNAGSQVVIEISKEFTQGPDNTGLFPAIPIYFWKREPTATPQVVLADEIITNSTGVDWLSFQWQLLGPSTVDFDTSDRYISIAPFTVSGFFGNDRNFGVDQGTLSHIAGNNVWFPGDGATDGNLIINADSSFTLKQWPRDENIPGVPESSTVLLLAAGAPLLWRRRRKRR